MRLLQLFIGLIVPTMVWQSTSLASEKPTPETLERYDSRPEVKAFVNQMVTRHGFDEQMLTSLFANVKRHAGVLKAISRPAEAKPWHEYRAIFITPKRINGGVQFWDVNEELLARAFEHYGVPPQIVVAILGVETFYGRRTGRFPVFDALTTLGFDYPPRSKFFLSELEQFLLLTREEALDITDIKGSYAGAMGKSQFISSSYRSYAIDFDNDGKRDLWESNADAIGSIANYFKRHGWLPELQVVLPVRLQGTAYKKLLDRGMKPTIKPHTLKWHGVTPLYGALGEDNVAFFEFDVEEGKQHWIGFNNFYVITRYNHSPLYALAVYQLSEKIKQAREKKLAKSSS